MLIAPSLNGAAENAAPDRRSRFARNLPVYYLFRAASGFLIWLPIWMVYLIDRRGMSLTQVAAMEAIFWIALMTAEVPTGAIADRWGRRVSLFLGGLGFAAASACFALSASFLTLAASYLLMAVSITLYSGAGHALLFDSLRLLGRANEYEKHVGRSDAASFGTMLAATLLGGPLTALIGFIPTILIGAAAMIAAASIALLLREPPRRESAYSDQSGAAVPNSVLGNMLAGARLVWRRRALLAVILFSALIFVVLEMPAFFLQTFVRFQGVDPRQGIGDGFLYSVLIIPPIAGMVVGSLLAAAVAGRFGERRSLPLLLLASALCFLPLTASNSLWVIAAVALLSVVRGMIRPIASGYINRRIPSDQRATVLSVFELSMGLMMAVLIPQIGGTADSYGFQWAFALCLAVLLALGGLFGLLWRRAHDREQVRRVITLNAVPKPQASPVPLPSAAPSAVHPGKAGGAAHS